MKPSTKPSSKRNYFILLVTAWVCYANTLGNQYVLDDFGLLIQNSMTEAGIPAWPTIFSSGFRATLEMPDTEFYRPIPKAFFALCWQLTPAKPLLPHLLNVLLFSLTVCLIYHILSRHVKLDESTSLLATFIFTIHPIHTEVVANAKSLDEILMVLFSLLSMRSAFMYAESTRLKQLGLCLAYLVMAMLSKESAIASVLIIPLALFVFAKDSRKIMIRSVCGLLTVSLACLLLRWQIIGSTKTDINPIMNYIVMSNTYYEQCIQAIVIQAYYILLLFLPFQLLSDASYAHWNTVALNNPTAIVSVLVIGVVLFLLVTYYKREPKIAFWGLFYLALLLPVSNVLFPIGTHYAERFLYFPSLAGCVLFALLLMNTTRFYPQSGSVTVLGIKLTTYAAIVFFGVSVWYVFATINRNADWKNNYTLFSADITKAPESAMLNAYYANALYTKARENRTPAIEMLNQAIVHYEQAISIFPNFDKACMSLADVYAMIGNVTEAKYYYLKAISLKPTSYEYNNNYGNYLFTQGNTDSAAWYFRAALKLNSNYAQATSNLASVYATRAKQAALSGDSLQSKTLFDRAINTYELAMQQNPSLIEPYEYAAMIYRFRGDVLQADILISKAQQLKRKQRLYSRLNN